MEKGAAPKLRSQEKGPSREVEEWLRSVRVGLDVCLGGL